LLAHLSHHFKRHWLRIAISSAILVFFLLHVAKRVEWDFLHRLENIAYDARLVFTMPRTKDPRIVIIDIDEKSLAAEGRWPWSRDKLAAMLDQLFDHYGVFLTAFDVVFAEAEETSGLKVLRQLEHENFSIDPAVKNHLLQMEAGLNHDQQFARSIANRRVVMGYFFTNADESGAIAKVGELPPPLFGPKTFAGRKIDFPHADGYGANLPILQNQAYAAGHFISEPDSDGVVRRVPMLYKYKDNYYPALALVVAQAVLKAERIVPGFPEQSKAGRNYTQIEWLELGKVKIPVDNHARTLVPFRGKAGSFPYVSATDVIHGKVDPEILKGRIVLLGTTAKGLLDLRATPVAPDFPGVEVHANLISGMLGLPGQTGISSNIKDNPAYTLGAEFVLLLVSGLIMAIALPAMSPLLATLTTVALLVGITGTNLSIWYWGNLVFPLATGIMSVLVLFLFNMSYGYLVEERGKRQLANQFGQYIPPELVDELNENPQAMSLSSVNKELSVLFSDIRGFTTISEGLSPHELSELMNEYLTPMTRIIFEHRGTIDKYMGDAIMAFWGAPLDDQEHARHAFGSAFIMLNELRNIQERFKAKGWPPIRIGIGINSGNMSVGNMGSEFRRAYTVMGDAVNLGSRLEGLTKNYGVELIVSESTARAVTEYAYRELDRVRVKGKDKPVTIYEPMGLKTDIDDAARSELKLYRQALKVYRSQNWDMAEIQFLNLQKTNPQRSLYKLYAERTAIFREHSPEAGWDGVFTHMTK